MDKDDEDGDDVVKGRQRKNNKGVRLKVVKCSLKRGINPEMVDKLIPFIEKMVENCRYASCVGSMLASLHILRFFYDDRYKDMDVTEMNQNFYQQCMSAAMRSRNIMTRMNSKGGGCPA